MAALMNINRITAVLAVAAAASCAHHVPEPVGIAPGTPHISWVFMSGDRDTPDRDYVCQSDPRDECIMPVSGPDDQVFADLHFYYHGAGAETKYTGTVEIGVFQGSPQTHRNQVNLTVKKNESITNQSVVGVVTSSPGTYAVKFDLIASTPSGGTQSITTAVPVTVK